MGSAVRSPNLVVRFLRRPIRTNEHAGAIYNVVAGGCYLLAWVLTCCTPKPKPLLRKVCCPGKADEESQRKDNNGVAESLDDLGTVDPNNANEYEPYDPDKPYDPTVYSNPDNRSSPHYASPY
jgi:hypothetical protein